MPLPMVDKNMLIQLVTASRRIEPAKYLRPRIPYAVTDGEALKICIIFRPKIKNRLEIKSQNKTDGQSVF